MSACGAGARGFTLLELAVVVFILGILMAGLIGPIETQLEARDRHRTQEILAQAAEALYGYAVTYRRLPCPDNTGDGMPDPPFGADDASSADCAVGSGNGFLPWAELGVDGSDAWGNRIEYRVRHREFTQPARDLTCNGDTANEYDLCSSGNIDIQTRGDDSATSGEIEGKFMFPAATASHVVAVLLSHGRNGYGATASDGHARATVPADHRDEAENADADESFVSRAYSREQSGCADDADESVPLCEFDDMVLPISRAVLNGRMVAAGQLP